MLESHLPHRFPLALAIVLSIGFSTAAARSQPHLSTDQGGSIEVGDSTGAGNIPYIDFHYGVGSDQDFNMRIINSGDRKLALTGGAVGIATWDPHATLDVDGSLAVQDLVLQKEGVFMVLRDRTEVGDWWGMVVDTSRNNVAFVASPRQGNVGIGTLLPDQRLTVDGRIKSTGGFVFPDGSVQLTASAQGERGEKGERGDPGPAGPAVKTIAICNSATSTFSGTCSCAVRTISNVTTFSTCDATSDTGSCRAGGLGSFFGSCCVCAP
jgi:hypothetical protein